LALAWSQVSFAAAHLHHDALDTGEVCAVCLQLERSDNATIDTSEVALQSTALRAAEAVVPVIVHREPFAYYRSRASP